MPTISRSVLLAVLLALGPLASSSCRTVDLEQLSPEELDRRVRMTYLVAKSAAARLVTEGIAQADDLAVAADLVLAVSGQNLPAAFTAANLSGDEWELLALLLEDRLSKWELHPLHARFVEAAASGVRDGALGVTPAENAELERSPES